ncbi:hypothetical protein AB0M31_09310 [Streptomyces sp. NPDC051773]|uniref:hypothetical protein n=1 Tax=Streptomyces sp. NPDC051773 TaxID=3156682 RepID=UPI0034496846
MEQIADALMPLPAVLAILLVPTAIGLLALSVNIAAAALAPQTGWKTVTVLCATHPTGTGTTTPFGVRGRRRPFVRSNPAAGPTSSPPRHAATKTLLRRPTRTA